MKALVKTGPGPGLELTDVPEPAIAAAMADAVRHEHVVVEGAGAVGLAAVATARIPALRGRRIVIVVSGANVDMARLVPILAGHVDP